MTKRVAVVTPMYGDSWSEADVVCRRLAGALATSADVDVLVPSGGIERVEHDGAVRLVRLPAFPLPPGRSEAVVQALLGPGAPASLASCDCLLAKGNELVDELPLWAQEELVRAGGGDSPRLWRHLAETRYDVVVLAGLATASTVFGVRHIDERTRVALLPLAGHGLLLRMPLLDELLKRVDCIVVSTETERSLMEQRRVGDAPIWNAGFVLRVNSIALAAPPHGMLEKHRYIVIPGDWHRARDYRWLERWSRTIRAEFGPNVHLRVVGPGAAHVLNEGGEEFAGSRLDVWRWISRSVGVIDPTPHRLLGREVIESMMFGTPVIVPAHGGASREHAQVGNGGLWYRTEAEMLGCLGALLEPDTRRGLSRQGREYAADGFADTDRFVKSVVKSVLEDE